MRTQMKLAGSIATFMAGTALLWAQDAPEMPEMPQPQAQHEWLMRFVGEWEFETEMVMDPDQPPLRATGTESVRAVGGFWIIAESRSEMMGMTHTNVLTFGYDPEREKYVGTSVDSASSHLWTYEGELDSAGRMTMEWEGPCHLSESGRANFRGATEFVSDDHRVFTASVQRDGGKWMPLIRANFRRTD